MVYLPLCCVRCEFQHLRRQVFCYCCIGVLTYNAVFLMGEAVVWICWTGLGMPPWLSRRKDLKGHGFMLGMQQKVASLDLPQRCSCRGKRTTQVGGSY